MKDDPKNIIGKKLEPWGSLLTADDGSLETLLRRDLDAWREAKAAVEKARRA